MTGLIAPRRIDDILEFMEVVSLVGMRSFEHSALSIESTDVPKTTDPVEENPAEVSITYAHFINETEFHTRFKLTFTEPGVVYSADIAGIYQMSEPIALAQEVQNEFAERVGIMAVFPFLRESVSTSAARMGLAVPLLGLMRPGDFRIEPPEDIGE